MGYTVMPERDADGNAIMPMTKFNEIGWSFHKQGMKITSSTVNGFVNKDDQGNDLGFLTINLYKDLAGTTLCADQADADLNCVKTVVDWEPTFDYEIIGGEVHQKSQPGSEFLLYVTAVPDFPAPTGSKPFICCLDLAYAPLHAGENVDGRRGKRLNYDAVYHTNKVRMILNHAAGLKHTFQLMLEMYKP